MALQQWSPILKMYVFDDAQTQSHADELLVSEKYIFLE
jgi:hypothetical protein